MKSKMIFTVLITASAFFQNVCAAPSIGIIPKPLQAELQQGSFTLDEKVVIVNTDSANDTLADYVLAAIGQQTGLSLKTKGKPPLFGRTIIFTSTGADLDLGDEGYTLSVGPKKIVIAAPTSAGLFYGVQSLLQLIPLGDADPYEIPCVKIKDRPRFPWRGLHLDVSRHFFGVDFIKKYIDLLAMHKMNIFHWHLIDDGGWRLEIQKYPKLTQLGAWRFGDGSHWDHRAIRVPTTLEQKNARPVYGGFYTQEEVRDIVDYARIRQVRVIPEIEMPGHCLPALVVYPEMKCQVNDMNGYDGGFYYQNAFCAGTEKSFEFLQDVLDETMELFPDEFIHIGADEVNKFFWSRCPNCQKRMQDQGLKDAHELQSYFVKRIEAYLNAKGRRLIGWDEILEGGLAPNATVMSWRGMAGGIAAAKAGHDVIMAPGDPVYFDSGQGPDERPIQKVYAFEPVPRDLTALEARHILGAQGQAWTEWMETTDDVEYKVYPRACALAEVLWSDPAQRNWANFQGRMSSHYDRLKRKNVNYCRPFLTGLADRTLFLDKQTVTIKKPIEDMIVRYTLDGTTPTENSPLYKGEFSIQSDCHVRAIGWFSDGYKTDELEGYFEKTVFHEPITADDLQPGLQCGYYPGRFDTVESIEPGQMQRTETVENFIFPKNIQMDNFGLIYKGFLKVEQDGIYTFYTASDDGSQLWIQGRRVVQNDGPHGQREKAGQMALKAGFHPIKVLFFEAGGSEVLSVSYEGPGIKKQPIPPGALFTKPSAEKITDYLKNETPDAFDRRMAWWRDARLGMFIHWGLYGIPAGEWNGGTNHAEWILTSAQIPVEQYKQFAPQFNPVQESRVSVLGEFGGLGWPVAGHLWREDKNWGYRNLISKEQLTENYLRLVKMLRPLIGNGLGAAIYTQTTDVEGEVNGLMTYDREIIKLDTDTVKPYHLKLYEKSPVYKTILPTSEKMSLPWRYTLDKPAGEWFKPGYDDRSWKSGKGVFAREGTSGVRVGTVWNTPELWIRKEFEVDSLPDDILLKINYDEDSEIYINGFLALKVTGYSSSYIIDEISEEAKKSLHTGINTISVHCKNTSGGQRIDVGLLGLTQPGENENAQRLGKVALSKDEVKGKMSADGVGQNLVNIKVSPAFNFDFDRMVPGVLQHLDRTYTYDVIPPELLDGLLFQGIHRPPAGTAITIQVLSPVRIYFFFHATVDGGYSDIFASLKGWTRCPVAPQYDIHNGDPHGLRMVMYKLTAPPGTYTIPPTTKDRACFSMVFQAIDRSDISDIELETVKIKSSADGTMQPARIYIPSSVDKPIPLVVALHTWSGDYLQPTDGVIGECRKRGWAMVFPDFRGPNKTSAACGSDLAVQDVLDAVAFMKARTQIDDRRIYLHGISGGGHMSLMMVTRAPETFAAASVWVPPTDLKAWYHETKSANRGYWQDIEQVCGGAPGSSDRVDAEYHKRSPLFALEHARGIAIDLNVGIHDGYTGSIPVTHTLKVFNRLAEVNTHEDAKLDQADIDTIRTQCQVPDALKFMGQSEPGRNRAILLRRKAGPVRLTVFEGSHEGDPPVAFQWFDVTSQDRNRKMETVRASGANWDMTPFVKHDKPVLSPEPDSQFHCPILDQEVHWEQQNVYNPAAVVKDGKVYLFYRADDKNPDLKWGRTCRIGMAYSEDGVHFTRHRQPVLYPDNDQWKQYEWEGGCEDLHIIEGEDGTYYMNYTTWNGQSDTVSMASSRDLYHWTKHGPAFGKAGKIGGRSGVVISRIKGNRLIAAKINGKYWMYYTHPCALAWSENLIDWTPAGKAVWPGGGHEAGAIALLGNDGILLMTQGGHPSLGAWVLRQALIDRHDLTSVLEEHKEPFLYPEYEWEKKGMIADTTVANGLVYFKGKWLLYYGAADRYIGLAVFSP